MARAARSSPTIRKHEKQENRGERLERQLEEGLRETFPASDALAVTEPAATPHDNGTGGHVKPRVRRGFR